MLKRCNRCGEEKPLDQFYKHPSTGDRLQTYCKACNVLTQREWYKNNKEYYAKYRKAWKAKKEADGKQKM